MSIRYRVRIHKTVAPVDGIGWFLSGHFDGVSIEPKAAPASQAYCYESSAKAAQQALAAGLDHFTVEPFDLSSVPVPLLGGPSEHRRLL